MNHVATVRVKAVLPDHDTDHFVWVQNTIPVGTLVQVLVPPIQHLKCFCGGAVYRVEEACRLSLIQNYQIAKVGDLGFCEHELEIGD